MCFYNDDCGWVAQISDVQDGPSPCNSTCIECGGEIKEGAHRRHVFQQESECCVICDDAPDSDCERHDYGNIFEADICDSCCKILRAIYAVEADEGCPEHSRQPFYGELFDAISNDRDGRYTARAISMFPELAEILK